VGATGVGTAVTYRLLEQRDIGAFVSWRGGDPYIDGLLWLSIGEHSERLRFILMALADEEIVGTVALVRTHPDADMADGEQSGYVEALEVKEGWRRRGVAGAMLARLAGLAVQEGFSRLTVMVEPHNEPALAFFNRLGFRAFKRSEFIWRGNTRPVVCLEGTVRGNHAAAGSGQGAFL